jgi:predicted nucleotidyltransferase
VGTRSDIAVENPNTRDRTEIGQTARRTTSGPRSLREARMTTPADDDQYTLNLWENIHDYVYTEDDE